MPRGNPGIRRKPLLQAIEEKCLITHCGCWIWLGCTDKDGYGFVRDQGKNKKVHRVLYEMMRGALGNRLACHTCDVPTCVNPYHIFPGTNSENQIDSVRKGRAAGVRNFKHAANY